METRFSTKLRALEARMLDGPGVVERARRRATAEGRPVGDRLADDYLDRIRTDAYAITERTIADLRAAGWTEDQIFELSICAAYGAAKRRLDAGLRAVEAARTTPVPEGGV